MSGLRRRVRRGRTRPYSNSIQLTDVQSILEYFSHPKRKTLYYAIGGQVEGLSNRGQDLEIERLSNLQNMEGETSASEEEDGDQLFGEEYGGHECFGPIRRGVEAVTNSKRRKVGGKQVRRMEIMIDIFKQHPMSPIDAVCKHRVWLTHPELKFLTPADREVKAALHNWTNQLVSWSTKDFWDLYTDSKCIPIFSAGYGYVEDYYYSPELSVDILDDLIKYQFNHDEEEIYFFMESLWLILERKQPKCNTLVVHSPPSAGKNFFFDCIKDYYINVGHLCNASKYNLFAFQDAESRRLLLWNEPNYSPEFFEPIKEILGGDSTSVNVKYMADTPVYRTPVIVLTNREVSFMSHEAFKDRICRFNWVTAPYLKDFNKKPHPLATYKLFVRYGFIKEE